MINAVAVAMTFGADATAVSTTPDGIRLGRRSPCRGDAKIGKSKEPRRNLRWHYARQTLPRDK
jgi:hypothetical protein